MVLILLEVQVITLYNTWLTALSPVAPLLLPNWNEWFPNDK